MSFLLEIAFVYIAIVYGLIPLVCLIYTIFMLIGGLVARIYYVIEDYLTEGHK
jgi:hypothetical protein